MCWEGQQKLKSARLGNIEILLKIYFSCAGERMARCEMIWCQWIRMVDSSQTGGGRAKSDLRGWFGISFPSLVMKKYCLLLLGILLYDQ